MVKTASMLMSELRRYKTATFTVGGAHYDVTGSIRAGLSLWLLSRAAHGFRRELITTFGSMDEVVAYVEENG